MPEPILTPQLAPEATELEAWLRKYASQRYRGLERMEPLADGACWSAECLFPRVRVVGRQEQDVMRSIWFLGHTPAEALALAKAAAREQLAKERRRA